MPTPSALTLARIALLVAIAPHALAQLPPEVELDRLASQAAAASEASNWPVAVQHLEAMQRLGVELPANYRYHYARALAGARRYVEARSSVETYLAQQGRQARFYAQALELFGELERPAAEQARALADQRARDDADRQYREAEERSRPLLRRVVTADARAVTTVAYSADGTQVLSGGSEGRVSHWQAGTGARQGDTPLGAAAVAVAHSPYTWRWAAASARQTAVWQAPGRPAVPGSVRPGDTRVLAFSPDGGTLAAGLQDGSIQLWDASTRLWSAFASVRGPVGALVYSPDGRWLAAAPAAGGDRRVQLWRVGEAAVHRALQLNGSPGDIVFSPDSRQLAVSDMSSANLVLWPMAASEGSRSLPLPPAGTPGARALAYEPGGRLLALARGPRVELIDPANGTVLARLTGPRSANVLCLAFSPDGQTLVAGDSEGKLRFWNVSGF